MSFPKNIFVIGLAGGSGSGKDKIFSEAKKVLTLEGINTDKVILELAMDRYFKNLDEVPDFNFDHLGAIDVETMQNNLISLKQRKNTLVPIYDFVTSNRLNWEQWPSSGNIDMVKVIIVIGHMLFAADNLRSLLDWKIFVDANADTRFIRRTTRDKIERGRSHEKTMDQWRKSVSPMHNIFIEPSKRFADIILPNDTDGVNQNTVMSLVLIIKQCLYLSTLNRKPEFVLV